MELQPLPLPDASAPITLTTLPSDVVRLIVRAAGPPLEQIRLISPTWNSMVLEYHKDRRNQPPLEAVHLHRGGPEQESDVVVNVAMAHDRPFRGAFKGWTAMSNINYESPSLRVRVVEWDRFNAIMIFLVYLVEVAAVAWRLHYTVSIAIIAVTIALLVRLFTHVRPGVIETRKKLAQIFRRCSSIGTLYIHKVNRETVEVVRKSLGDVPIKNLVVYDSKCDQDLRALIVNMVRLHKVEQVTVCTKKLRAYKLREFILASTETAKRLDIYESTKTETKKIFGCENQFWEKKTKEMSDDSFSVMVMNGQQLPNGQGSQLFRLRIFA